jgi:hypothetical protein
MFTPMFTPAQSEALRLVPHPANVREELAMRSTADSSLCVEQAPERSADDLARRDPIGSGTIFDGGAHLRVGLNKNDVGSEPIGGPSALGRNGATSQPASASAAKFSISASVTTRPHEMPTSGSFVFSFVIALSP